jgi:hypothetical protein
MLELGALRDHQLLQLVDIIGKSTRLNRHALRLRDSRVLFVMQNETSVFHRSSRLECIHAATSGRQVRCGRRQSMPSSNIDN